MDRSSSSSAWVFAAIAGCTAITSVALLYHQKKQYSCTNKKSKLSSDDSFESRRGTGPEEEEEGMSGEEEEENDEDDVDNEELLQEHLARNTGNDLSEPSEKAVLQAGSFFFAIFAFWMMVIVSCVALIFMNFDDDISSPTEYTLYLPLMYLGIGILGFSLTQGIDQTIFQQPLVKKPQPTSQESSTFTSNTSVGNKKKSDTRNTNRINSISTRGTEKEIQTLLANADEFYDQKNHYQIYRILTQEVSKNSKNEETLWRLARACYDLHEGEMADVEKKKLVAEGLDFAEKAIQANTNCAAAYKWMSIMTSAMGKFKSTKDQIAGAYTIHSYITKAIALDPTDATSRHILGQWCYTLADMSWIERRAASTLFGTPPTSTYDNALEQYLAAESISPGFWKKNMFCIAQSYEKLNDRAQAKVWLEKAQRIAIQTDEDTQTQQKIEALVKQIS